MLTIEKEHIVIKLPRFDRTLTFNWGVVGFGGFNIVMGWPLGANAALAIIIIGAANIILRYLTASPIARVTEQPDDTATYGVGADFDTKDVWTWPESPFKPAPLPDMWAQPTTVQDVANEELTRQIAAAIDAAKTVPQAGTPGSPSYGVRMREQFAHLSDEELGMTPEDVLVLDDAPVNSYRH